MASPLVFKVYTPEGIVASCKFAEDAAAVVALHTDRGTIQWDGRIVWREGREDQPASDSYDYVAQVVGNRIREIHARVALRRAHRRIDRSRDVSDVLGALADFEKGLSRGS
jgi:hypothetical protein